MAFSQGETIRYVRTFYCPWYVRMCNAHVSRNQVGLFCCVVVIVLFSIYFFSFYSSSKKSSSLIIKKSNAVSMGLCPQERESNTTRPFLSVKIF